MELKISAMQHFSTGDGPGIRTTIFFQGCNLKCPWCHNPEAMPARALMRYAERCIGCSVCVRACPNGALSIVGGKIVYDRKKCKLCGKCTELCPALACTLSGKDMSLDEVYKFIDEDKDFYEVSGGGATFSGGEPMLQPKAAAELAKKCHENGISVIIETAGCVPFENFEQVLPYVDEFYFDVKAPDAARYSSIGGNFELILSNLKRLAPMSNVTAKIPLIPGFNNSPEDIRALAKLIYGSGIKKAELLPFHRLATGKYEALGCEYPYADTPPAKRSEVEATCEIFRAALPLGAEFELSHQ